MRRSVFRRSWQAIPLHLPLGGSEKVKAYWYRLQSFPNYPSLPLFARLGQANQCGRLQVSKNLNRALNEDIIAESEMCLSYYDRIYYSKKLLYSPPLFTI